MACLYISLSIALSRWSIESLRSHFIGARISDPIQKDEQLSRLIVAFIPSLNCMVVELPHICYSLDGSSLNLPKGLSF